MCVYLNDIQIMQKAPMKCGAIFMQLQPRCSWCQNVTMGQWCIVAKDVIYIVNKVNEVHGASGIGGVRFHFFYIYYFFI